MAAIEPPAQAREHKPNEKGETPEIAAAFDMYVKMGTTRSTAKVARSLGIPTTRVYGWSKKFKWQERVLALQKEAVDQAAVETKKSFFKDVANLTDYKYTLLDILKKKVDTSRFCGACEQSPASITEIIRVLEVVKTELGEPTSIAKGTFVEDKGNPFAGIFNSFFGKHDDSARAV